MIENGKSRFLIIFSIGTGLIIAHTPSTISRLNRLEPTTLLTAISLLPLSAAEVLTASSGALVPSATIVRPMITDGTLNSAASDELPSTNISAPLISAIKPSISRTTCKTISIIILPFRRRKPANRPDKIRIRRLSDMIAADPLPL